MKEKIKKGFTLVELLVVIAILAILATVSVISYGVFVNSAKQSADEQAVTQMNVALDAQKALEAPKNVEEAKDVLEAAGFNVDDYVPLQQDNIFYYDAVEIKVLIFNQSQNKVIFPADLASKYANLEAGQKPASWFRLNDKTFELVSIDSFEGTTPTEKFNNALLNTDEYSIISLTSDVTLGNVPGFNISENIKLLWSSMASSTNGVARIDLNGHTMNVPNGMFIGNQYGPFGNPTNFNQNIYISNGTISSSVIGESIYPITVDYGSTLTVNNVEFTVLDTTNASKNCFSVREDSTLNIENSTITAETGDSTAVFLGTNNAKVNISNSDIKVTTYGITTNALTSSDVSVNVDGSTITSENGPAILVNVTGVYDFKDTTLVGDGHGAIIRGGDAYFENCTIRNDGNSSSLMSTGWEISTWQDDPNFPKGIWRDGNMVQLGTLIVGDWSSSYRRNASATLINSNLYMNDEVEDLPIVYLSQDGNFVTTLKYDSNTKFYKENNIVEPNKAILENSVESVIVSDDTTISKGTINVETI